MWSLVGNERLYISEVNYAVTYLLRLLLPSGRMVLRRCTCKPQLVAVATAYMCARAGLAWLAGRKLIHLANELTSCELTRRPFTRG